jgi:hypothetical protein
VSQSELAAARTAVASASRKQNLLRRITEVALQSAKQEFERTKRLAETGVISNDGAFETHAKIRILEEILSTRPSDAGSDKRKPQAIEEDEPASKQANPLAR